MKRRKFITLVGGAVLWPSSLLAQQRGKTYRIGVLENVSRPLNSAEFDAFRNGLRELGDIESQTFVVEYRSADGRNERFPDLAAELVRMGVDVIVTRGTPATIAAKNATTTIPIVMVAVGDPVASGLVANLARPGGNVTGPSLWPAVEVVPKVLELLQRRRSLHPTRYNERC